MSWKKTPGLTLLTVALALALGSSLAAAQEAPRLRIDMQVEKEVQVANPDGGVEIQREPVVGTTRGDVLVYTLAIVNEGSQPARNARVVDPVPEGTVLLPESVMGPGSHVSYSADGGHSFGEFPITRSVIGPDGLREDQPIPIEEYTHVRWTLTEPLAPGQVRTANFKVRVE
jgi:uncharacterized repeat protein (TIGR01451 family)